MRIGLTSGCFDLIHYGHVHYLERCKNLCDKLLVGVDCDAMVREAKGADRPVIPELERLEMIQNLAPVDAAFLLPSVDGLEEIVRQFQVTFLFKHRAFLHGSVVGVGTGLAALVIVPDIPGLRSTSEIIRRIRHEE